MISVEYKVNFTITFTVTKEEARALLKFADFSNEDILRVYTERLGTGLREHETGLSSFLNQVRINLPVILQSIRDVEARTAKPTEARHA